MSDYFRGMHLSTAGSIATTYEAAGVVTTSFAFFGTFGLGFVAAFARSCPHVMFRWLLLK